MVDLNPQLREMMQNPELLRQLMNPETMQVLSLSKSANICFWISLTACLFSLFPAWIFIYFYNLDLLSLRTLKFLGCEPPIFNFNLFPTLTFPLAANACITAVTIFSQSTTTNSVSLIHLTTPAWFPHSNFVVTFSISIWWVFYFILLSKYSIILGCQ